VIMRAVTHGDVVSAARCLLTLPEAERAWAMDRMLMQAHAADRYARRLGRVHPIWGAGTLSDVARAGRLPPEPGLEDRAYCSCLELVFARLTAWRARADQPEAQSTQRVWVGSSASRFGAMGSPQSSQ